MDGLARDTVLDPAGRHDRVTAAHVLLLTSLMAAASALGAVPYAVARARTKSKSISALANACACGVMLAASFDLVHEGQGHGPFLTALGLGVGAWTISKAQAWLSERDEGLRFGSLRGADARKTLMMIGIMTAHALGEGCGVGVSFSGDGGRRNGRVVTLAIGAHNVPEGMAVANVLASRGASAWTCAMWCVITSLPQPMLAVPAFLFVETFERLLPVALGFAAGCMVWIVFAELLPDALADSSDAKSVATTVTMSAGALELFRVVCEGLETLSEASASDGALGDVSSAVGVGLAANLYAPVGALTLTHVFPSLASPALIAPGTGMGIAASTAGISATFRLLWAIWRGVTGGAEAVLFVILGGLVALLSGVLALRWTGKCPSLADMRPWSDIDDDDAEEVDIEGRVLTRRFGNVLFTKEAVLAFLAAIVFAIADGAHATTAVISNSWYTLLPALMRACMRIVALVMIVASTDRRPYVIGAVAIIGAAFVGAVSVLGVNRSSSGTCLFYDTVAAVLTLVFVQALKPFIVFAMMTKSSDLVAGVMAGGAVTTIFAVSTWAMCAGTNYCDISSA